MRIKADTLTRNRERILEAMAMLPDHVLLEVERRQPIHRSTTQEPDSTESEHD